MTYDVCIIGGGLSGLALAYFLKGRGLSVAIIEARDRLGGRIETYRCEDGTLIELGATWLGEKHRDLTSLLKELAIDIIPQYMGDKAIYEPISTSPHMIVDLPPNDHPSFRIKGGSSQLISALADQLNCDVLLGEIVGSIDEQDGLLRVNTDKRTLQAQRVVSTLPPYLFLSTVITSPELPKELVDVMNQTHTWMGESIKIGLSYTEAFWKGEGLSGTIVSNVGPIPEMYDHTNHSGDRYALKGFLNGSYASLTQAERKEMVLHQLRKYFGSKVDTYVTYVDKPWRFEVQTFLDYTSYVLPHQHNGHPAYQQPYLDGLLWIAGAETSTRFPGYMNGAVASARYIAERLSDL